jgi:predicted amidohydrolase YtcJ
VNRTHGALGSHLVADEDQLHHLRTVARGDEPGDLVIRGGLVASFTTMEWLPYDVVVAEGRIAAVVPPGRLDCREEIDAKGLHVVPNHIDAHLHIEYTMLTPGQLARLSVPRGQETAAHTLSAARTSARRVSRRRTGVRCAPVSTVALKLQTTRNDADSALSEAAFALSLPTTGNVTMR